MLESRKKTFNVILHLCDFSQMIYNMWWLKKIMRTTDDTFILF